MKRPILLLMCIIAALIPVFSGAMSGTDRNAFQILGQTSNSIDIAFQLPQWRQESESRQGENFNRVVVDDANYLFIDEDETLPVFSTCIAIPYSGGAELSVLGTSANTVTQFVADFDGLLTRERQAGRYSANLYPASRVAISEPMVIRDYRIVTLNIYPFQYDQALSSLNVSESITLRISFNNLPSVNEIPPPAKVSKSFEEIYRALILNFDEASTRNLTYQPPVMLIIYRDSSDPTYQMKVNDYITWRRKRGFVVHSASTAANQAGNTATSIKNYIQNAWNTWTDRPEYIVLMGDAGSGSFQIPTSGSYDDYQYTHLAGGDILGDAVIGRISVENTEHIINYMAKLDYHERTILSNSTEFLNRMLLVGDSASSGISTIYTNRYIRQISEYINPAYTYTELYQSGPSPSAMNTALNVGVSFFNYRGYIGMSGWNSTYINQLNNANRMFHAVIITCATGNFSGTTGTTESVVRLGSASQLVGAITAIGMATSSTHTPMNNILDLGIFQGIYGLGMRDMGSALLYGKLYLNSVYGVSNPTQAAFFAQICNLIGDPATDVYVGMPNRLTVSYPSSLPAGSTDMNVIVRNTSNQPIEYAVVVLSNTTGLQVQTTTAADGTALLSFPGTTTGSLTLTANKDGYAISNNTVTINSAGGYVLDEVFYDDGYGGVSSGNGDGNVNSGETIEMWLSLRNSTAFSAVINGTASTTNPWVTILDDRVTIGTIAAGEVVQSSTPVIFTVAPGCPDGHRIVFTIADSGPMTTWSFVMPVTVFNGNMEIQSFTMIGATNNIVNPGDEYPLTFSISNNGLLDIPNLYGVLRSYGVFFTIPDSTGYFGSIAAGATASNGDNTFTIHALGQCLPGMVIPLELYLYNFFGFSQTLSLSLTIGQVTINSPLGQDAYGYFIFDWGDVGYPQCPTYNWIGIAPAEGGSGTALSLYDPGSSSDEGDQNSATSIQTVTLPFIFRFYGVDYTQASISSNGFIAFGASQNSDWRNGRLPGPGGPNPMIAVFWDDLQLNAGSYVYTYFNAAQHYYVVEWYNVINGYDRVTPETFQAILYDPAHYPTLTGDGQIKLQYHTFNNIDLGSGDTHPHGNYCTIGIKNQTGTVGLEYTFNNQYPTAARPLSHQKALFITTAPIPMNNPYLTVEQVTVVDPDGDGLLEPAETAGLSVRLGNIGMVDATNVTAQLSTSDPNVSVLVSTAAYGNIPASGNAYPLSNFSVQVVPNCPHGHQVEFELVISSSEGSWNQQFTVMLHAPDLVYGNMIIQDSSGNNNGRLDPGETVNVIIPLNNAGGSPAAAGSCILTSPTPGITINSGTSSFGSIAPGGSVNLTFNVTASSSMTVGSMAIFVFNTTAGAYTATQSTLVEIGAPIEVLIGTGTATQTYPLDRWYNYSVHEAIYLASAIPVTGSIKSLAYYKGSGADVNPIEAVSIYMKHTTASTLSTGNYSLTGYTLVYSGSFTNNATSGWMEVLLDPMFAYDGVSNLSILVIKGFQAWISNYPNWRYSNAGANRARQNRSDSSLPTSLSATSNLPNLQLKIFAVAGAIFPPENLAATASHQTVILSWSAPASANPDSYRVYRNSSLLSTVTAMGYTDTAVSNGTTYSYHVTAMYGSDESDPSNTVTATPNAYAPENLAAVPGNMQVSLSWTGVAGREGEQPERTANRLQSGYRVYRNGTAIADVTTTDYLDQGLINGVLYSYYVTTLYSNPDGESPPSNTATAMPTMVSTVIIGTGTMITPNNYISPVNIAYMSVHGQSVYTAAELIAAGVNGPAYITGMGFYVGSPPEHPLVNYVIRIKHTTATNAQNWHTQEDLETVWTHPSYEPIAGGYDMLTFQTPFLWNGTDNIMVDTAFGIVTAWSHTGTLQYTSMNNGYRKVFSDTVNQTNIFTGGNTSNFRPNIQFSVQSTASGPLILLTPDTLDYGNVEIGDSSTLQFTIENTGDLLLTGLISTLEGYTVTEASESGYLGQPSLFTDNNGRNTLEFNVDGEQSKTYNLTFTPTAEINYNGSVEITSNAENLPETGIVVNGTGYLPTLDAPEVSITAVPGSVTLNWAAVPNATQYQIFRATDPLGQFTLIGTSSTPGFTDSSGLPQAFYYVKAVRTIPTRR